MTDLPELSKSAKRKLALQWSSLLNQHKLNGEHLQWHDSQRDALSRGGRIGPVDGWRGRRGSYKVDERLVDREGIGPSVAIAKSRLYHLATAYWQLWSVSAGCEIFASWLDLLKGQVLEEVASIWKGHSEALDRWYERACRPALEKALSPKVGEFESWALNAELKALEQATTYQDIETSSSSAHRLNVSLINNWMKDEGYSNEDLSNILKISVRTVSSLRNNGDYHGEDAVTKLANLMRRDVEDLYLL